MATALDRTGPMIVIVGPTASGKSALAMEVATKLDGEIICADSRTVYRGMDIGTAKPDATDQARVPHHGLNLVDPDQRFSTHDFLVGARRWVSEIQGRARVPIVVGGTGLYVDSLIFDYQLGGPSDPAQHHLLEAMDIAALQSYCKENNIELPKNTQNKRHLIRAIEQNSINHKSNRIVRLEIIVVGITTSKQQQLQRIEQRIDAMFRDGVVKEAASLAIRFGWNRPAFSGNIYQIIHQYQGGELTLAQAKVHAAQRDRQLVKRQLTWFRRNPFIVWGQRDELAAYIYDRYARISE